MDASLSVTSAPFPFSLFLSKTSVFADACSTAARHHRRRDFLIAATASAVRPYKTLGFISSTSTAEFPVDQNPNQPVLVFLLRNSPLPRSLSFTITEIRELNYPNPTHILPDLFDSPRIALENHRAAQFHRLDRLQMAYPSAHARTKDVMRIFSSLLFGMGCGALTAATMCLFWSMVFPVLYEIEDSDDDFGDSDDDADAGLKMMEYMSIPNADTKCDSELPLAKEVV